MTSVLTRMFSYLIWKSSMSLDNSWSLNGFCFVWFLAQVSHNSSGSSHVLQKCVAWTLLFSEKQGSQKCLSSISLKYLKEHFVIFFLIFNNVLPILKINIVKQDSKLVYMLICMTTRSLSNNNFPQLYLLCSKQDFRQWITHKQ